MRFREIRTADGILATYSGGSGEPLLFLHGGPGDTHHYLREVARELSDASTCILFDQRGTGRSFLAKKDASTLTLQKFIEDIDAVLDSYGHARAALFGHSWGAMLGLFYGMARPHRVSRAALVSMGPLTDEYGRANGERLLAALTREERTHWNELRTQRTEAVNAGDTCRTLMLDNEMMILRAKSWIAKPELRDSFLASYFADPPVNRFVNKSVWNSLPEFDWAKLIEAKSPILLCQGNEDANPIEQLKELAKHLPNSQTKTFPTCGHIPWVDQKETFYKTIKAFLNQQPTQHRDSD